jgi:hypothetical protein
METHLAKDTFRPAGHASNIKNQQRMIWLRGSIGSVATKRCRSRNTRSSGRAADF